MMWRRIQWQGKNCNKLQYIYRWPCRFQLHDVLELSPQQGFTPLRLVRSVLSLFHLLRRVVHGDLQMSLGPEGLSGVSVLCWSIQNEKRIDDDWWWLMQREIEPTSIQAASDRVTRFAGGLGPVCEQNCGLGPSLHSLHLRYMFGIVWAHYCDRSKWRQWPYPNGGL